MSFYSRIGDRLNAAVQTKDAAKVTLASREAGRSEFLRLDAAKDALLEVSRAAKELVFGGRHFELMKKLLFNQNGCANQTPLPEVSGEEK